MGIFGRLELESRFFEKFGGTLGGAGVMTERFAPVKWRVAEEWG